MPYLVNGQMITEGRICAEEARMRHDPQWKTIASDAERVKRMREAAELSAIDVALVEQVAASDLAP
jgi:hypothetical protein